MARVLAEERTVLAAELAKEKTDLAKKLASERVALAKDVADNLRRFRLEMRLYVAAFGVAFLAAVLTRVL